MSMFSKAILILSLLIIITCQVFVAQTRKALPPPRPYRNGINDSPETTSRLARDSVLSLVGRWGAGVCQAVDIKGSFLFRGNGPDFETLDISNPDSPKVVARLATDGLVRDLKISGRYAYVVTPLMVIDISNPLAPMLVSTFAAGGAIRQIAIDSPFVYLGSFATVSVVDVSDPSHPTLRGWNATSGDMVTGIAYSDPFLYVTTYDGLQMDIYNAQNKDSILYMGGSGAIQPGSPLATRGKYLYANQVTMFDLADPVNPRRVCKADLPGLSTAISVKDSLVYVSLGQGGFGIADLADTLNPRVVGYHDWIGYKSQSLAGDGPYRHAISDDHAYLASLSGLWTAEVTNDSISSKNFSATSYITADVYIDSTIVYSASWFSGINIVNINDPTSPILMANIKTNLPTFKVAERNHVLIALDADYTRGELMIEDVSNPFTPIELSRISFQESTFSTQFLGSIAFAGQDVYLSFGDARIKVMDISDTTSPRLLDDFSTTGNVAGLALVDHFLYSAEKERGLRIYDVASSSNPELADSLSIVALGVELQGSQLIVATDTGLSTFDVSNPQTPVWQGGVGLPGSRGIVPMAASAHFLYSPISTFYVTDIINPNSPRIVSALLNSASSVTAFRDIVIAGNTQMGALVYRNNLITSVAHESQNQPRLFHLDQNYPNPFNPSTIIRFTLDQPSKTSLIVYDLLGEEVVTLFDGPKARGTYLIRWDGRNKSGQGLPSGVYVYQLKSGGFSDTKKLLLLH